MDKHLPFFFFFSLFFSLGTTNTCVSTYKVNSVVIALSCVSLAALKCRQLAEATHTSFFFVASPRVAQNLCREPTICAFTTARMRLGAYLPSAVSSRPHTHTHKYTSICVDNSSLDIGRQHRPVESSVLGSRTVNKPRSEPSCAC